MSQLCLLQITLIGYRLRWGELFRSDVYPHICIHFGLELSSMTTIMQCQCMWIWSRNCGLAARNMFRDPHAGVARAPDSGMSERASEVVIKWTGDEVNMTGLVDWIMCFRSLSVRKFTPALLQADRSTKRLSFFHYLNQTTRHKT